MASYVKGCRIGYWTQTEVLYIVGSVASAGAARVLHLLKEPQFRGHVLLENPFPFVISAFAECGAAVCRMCPLLKLMRQSIGVQMSRHLVYISSRVFLISRL